MRIRHNIGVIKKFYFKRTKKETDFNIKIAEIKYLLCYHQNLPKVLNLRKVKGTSLFSRYFISVIFPHSCDSPKSII